MDVVVLTVDMRLEVTSTVEAQPYCYVIFHVLLQISTLSSALLGVDPGSERRPRYPNKTVRTEFACDHTFQLLHQSTIDATSNHISTRVLSTDTVRAIEYMKILLHFRMVSRIVQVVIDTLLSDPASLPWLHRFLLLPITPRYTQLAATGCI